MKTNVTYIPSSKFLELLEAAAMTHVAQSGFLKVEPVKGRRIYIANTKKVGRVDISGFEVSQSIGKTPDGGKFGQVTQQLRMEGTEDEVLTRFAELLKELAAQAPVEKVARPPRTAKSETPDAPEGAGEEAGTTPVAVDPVATAKARLGAISRIKSLASSMKAGVSQKVLEEEAALMNQLIELEAGLISAGTVDAPPESAPTAS